MPTLCLKLVKMGGQSRPKPLKNLMKQLLRKIMPKWTNNGAKTHQKSIKKHRYKTHRKIIAKSDKIDEKMEPKWTQNQSKNVRSPTPPLRGKSQKKCRSEVQTSIEKLTTLFLKFIGFTEAKLNILKNLLFRSDGASDKKLNKK